MMLVPQRIGQERAFARPVEGDGLTYDVEGAEFTAEIGSGFNPDNLQHRRGSDGLRYAIALAQLRESKDYDAFDASRAAVMRYNYRVDVGKDFVRVVRESEQTRLRRAKDRRRGRNSQ